MRGAAGDVGDAPLVGGVISKPFKALAASSRDLAATAQDYQDTVADIATVTGLVVALVPIVLLLALWLPRRIAWVVEASAATRLMRTGAASAELLAVRALARQPLRRAGRASAPTSSAAGATATRRRWTPSPPSSSTSSACAAEPARRADRSPGFSKIG